MNPALAAIALSGAKQALWTDGYIIPATGAGAVPLRLWRRAKRSNSDFDGLSMGVWITKVHIHVDRADWVAEPETGDQFSLDGPFGGELWRVCERASGETFMGNQIWRVPVEPVTGSAATVFLDGTG